MRDAYDRQVDDITGAIATGDGASASSAMHPCPHPAPAGFGADPGAIHEPAPKRWQDTPVSGREMGRSRAPSEARLPTFFRCAESLPAASSGRKEKRTGSGVYSEGGQAAAKKVGSRAFCGAPQQGGLGIRSSRPEMLPKPRPSAVRGAKGHGVEGFRAAR